MMERSAMAERVSYKHVVESSSLSVPTKQGGHDCSVASPGLLLVCMLFQALADPRKGIVNKAVKPCCSFQPCW